MVFKIKELKDFISSINKQRIERINIESRNLLLTISTIKSKGPISFRQNKTKNASKKVPEIKGNSIKKIEEKEKISQEQSVYFTIVSPMIGTFYRSPAPNEGPFINVNDKVKTHQTVCIIEAMKLMNEIESEVNGDIVEILVQDGDIVDCGQALMKVKQV